MMKRKWRIIPVLCLALWALCGAASADNISGFCGENVTWNLTNGTLTISGRDFYESLPTLRQNYKW